MCHEGEGAIVDCPSVETINGSALSDGGYTYDAGGSFLRTVGRPR